MLYAPFGRTGHHSSRVIFGAAALGAMSSDRAAATLALARHRGINHIDTAASYGAAEDRLAPFLAEHRSEVFLATKTGERTAPAARRELERSLERMGVDQVDLIQLHNLVEVCAERQVAVQTIKSVARRRWAADSSEPHFAWYEPLPPGPALARAVAFVLSRPGLFLNSSSDARLLAPICDAAENMAGAPADAELAADATELDMAALFDGAALERI